MESFFSEVAAYNLTKKRLHHKVFPANSVKLFRAVCFSRKCFFFLFLLGLYGVLKAVTVFFPLHFDSCPCAALPKQFNLQNK